MELRTTSTVTGLACVAFDGLSSEIAVPMAMLDGVDIREGPGEAVGLADVAEEHRTEGREIEVLPREVEPQDLADESARISSEGEQEDREHEALFLHVGAPGERP